MNKKLAVIAGTPVDTEFGKIFLETITKEKVLHFAVSKNPNAQNLLQLNNPEKLFRICLKKFLEFKKKGVKQVVIYCNSLSSAIDVGKLKQKSSLKIITPIQVYSTIPHKYKNILIIAANSVGATLPEKIIRQNNSNVKITTIGYLSLVNQIESKTPPHTIIKNCGLKSILEFSEEINIDLILLACTHFPYISDILKRYAKIDILDLNNGIKKLIAKN